MARNLTGKQQLFVAHYLDTLNATEAAKKAGYKGKRSTLAVIGYENLRKPNVASAIAEGMEELAMPRQEVLTRLTLMARGVIKTRQSDTVQGRMDHFDSIKALELLGRSYGLFTEEMVLSWKQEAERAGLSASELFERMVAEIIAEMTRKSAAD